MKDLVAKLEATVRLLDGLELMLGQLWGENWIAAAIQAKVSEAMVECGKAARRAARAAHGDDDTLRLRLLELAEECE